MDFLRLCISLRDTRYHQPDEEVIDLGSTNDIVFCGRCSTFGGRCCGWHFCHICVNPSDSTTVEKRYWHGPSIRKGILSYFLSNFRNLRIDLKRPLPLPL